MNVIVDVRGMNVNMRIRERVSIRASAKGAHFNVSLGQRPGVRYESMPTASSMWIVGGHSERSSASPR